MKKYLREGWKDFERKCIHPAAGDVQRRSMEQAFYAGALVTFATLETQVSHGEEITDEDMSLMESLDGELRAYAEELRRLAQKAKGTG